MELSNRTPSPRQVRLSGTLDMIRYSTRAFALKLLDGKEIHGVLDRPEMVDALAVYRTRECCSLAKPFTGLPAPSCELTPSTWRKT
jgi:hypothetical protein